MGAGRRAKRVGVARHADSMDQSVVLVLVLAVAWSPEAEPEPELRRRLRLRGGRSAEPSAAGVDGAEPEAAGESPAGAAPSTG